jgi:hypothetical protein
MDKSGRPERYPGAIADITATKALDKPRRAGCLPFVTSPAKLTSMSPYTATPT